MSYAAAPARVITSLVTGPTAGARERLIAAQLAAQFALAAPAAPAVPAVAHVAPTASAAPAAPAAPAASGCVAVLLEGLPDGLGLIAPSACVLIARIAPGCLCCTGNLVLRVTLNRLLRQRPKRLYIALALAAHVDQLRSWLLQPPYDQLLELTPDLGT